MRVFYCVVGVVDLIAAGLYVDTSPIVFYPPPYGNQKRDLRELKSTLQTNKGLLIGRKPFRQYIFK